MSTLKTTYIQHPSAAEPAIELNADGSVDWPQSGAINVYADSSARSTAIPSPSEGIVTYLMDTNKLEVYDGSAWKVVGMAEIDPIVATGGDAVSEFIQGDVVYKAHRFEASGDFIVTSAPGGTALVDYLLVAGGGGGGGANYYGGAAGGGGGVLTGSVGVSAGTSAVVVGNGGAGGSGANTGTNGANSTFASKTAVGGGGGANGSVGAQGGNAGGSGGGGYGFGGNGGAGTAGQGFRGGMSLTSTGGAPGSGAGGAASLSGTGTQAGAPLVVSYGGQTFAVSPGGGIGAGPNTGANGKAGDLYGGGGYSPSRNPEVSGTLRTGGAGANGIVIIQYPVRYV